MKTLYIVLFIFHLFCFVTGQPKQKVDQNGERIGYVIQHGVYFKQEKLTDSDTIHQLRTLLKNGIFEFLQMYSEPRNALNFNVSMICLNHTMEIIRDISNPQKKYAQRMIDADFKIPSGVLDGNLRWLGSYEECVSDTTHLMLQGQRFSSKYCLVSFPVLNNFEMSLGTCLPSTCNSEDAKGLINTVLSLVNISAPKSVCVEDRSLTTGAVVALTICMVIFFLILTGTIAEVFFIYFDEYTAKKLAAKMKTNVNGDGECTERTGLLSGTTNSSYTDSVPVVMSDVPKVSRCRIIMAFSIITNTRKLMNTSTANSPLACLNGMRVISMWWVILGHTFLFAVSFVDNPLEAYQIVQRFSFQVIINSTFSVDTFFFMSGLLVVYNCLKMLRENNGRMKWHLFYLHRYLRLTPAYAFVIMVFASLTAYMGTSPFFSYCFDDDGPFTYESNECSKTWWANIFYINNFYPNYGNMKKQCMGWSWYLANDMQFYICSPIIIILLYKFRKVGITVIVVLIWFGCIVPRILISTLYGIYLPDQMKATLRTGDIYAKNDLLYNKPYTRMSTYLVGMLVGWFLYHNKCRMRMPKSIALIGWCVAVAVGMAVVYGLYDYHQLPPKHASLGISVFYISLSRLAWGVALAWVTIACATGYGGPANLILSWKIWTPLGRLTYCAYLVHPMILYVYTIGLTTTFHYTDWTMIHLYLANLIVSYAVAYIVSMAVEAPMLGLEKLAFKR